MKRVRRLLPAAPPILFPSWPGSTGLTRLSPWNNAQIIAWQYRDAARSAAPDTTIHLWHNGNAQIVGVQHGFHASEPDEAVTLTWFGQRAIRDLRSGQVFSRADHFTATLGTVTPLLLSFTP